MNYNDILIKRTVDEDGTPASVPAKRTGEIPEDVWEVAAAGHNPATAHPFIEALRMARKLQLQDRNLGDIYRQDGGRAPVLFEVKF
jgi:hypothetical protein